jgi:hypothetical protein
MGHHLAINYIASIVHARWQLPFSTSKPRSLFDIKKQCRLLFIKEVFQAALIKQ